MSFQVFEGQTLYHPLLPPTPYNCLVFLERRCFFKQQGGFQSVWSSSLCPSNYSIPSRRVPGLGPGVSATLAGSYIRCV